ncbi:MAG: response regulator transcription factor [Balneolaceae bacterium]|nr:response regulator transcription factor [Balneolaceae bacterium]
MDKIRILIADDHEIIRFGISTHLSSAEDMDVVGEASSGEECLTLFKETQPDVCLIDITMPGMNGLESARAMREIDRKCRMAILSMHLDSDLLAEALQSDIHGYLLKSIDREQLLHCVRVVHNGQHVFSKEVFQLMSRAFASQKFRFGKLKSDITDREREVLKLIVRGMTSLKMARELNISPRTIETHRSNLLKKLGVKNTAELVRMALENQEE